MPKLKKKQPTKPATEAELRTALTELCDALESCEIVNEVEAGCDNDGAYVRACKALRRKPKLDPAYG